MTPVSQLIKWRAYGFIEVSAGFELGMVDDGDGIVVFRHASERTHTTSVYLG